MEPFFDIYKGAAELSGATMTHIPLRPATARPRSASELVLDLDELRRTLTPRTRLLLLNTPHNPTGKVFTRAELEGIAGVLQDFPNCLVVSDEVYEHLVFDGAEHVPFASIPGAAGASGMRLRRS
jgi:aspartate/methionine/tyrosine aminotransferase